MISKSAKCRDCGGEVWFDAWADINGDVVGTFDNNICSECDGHDVRYDVVEVEDADD
jgi:hypothetical protein